MNRYIIEELTEELKDNGYINDDADSKEVEDFINYNIMNDKPMSEEALRELLFGFWLEGKELGDIDVFDLNKERIVNDMLHDYAILDSGFLLQYN